jgi:5-aminopentanamidase
MRVAAYQAPYRAFPAPARTDLVADHLVDLRGQGVDLLCCPEAVVGELANESDGDDPGVVALSVSEGELDEACKPLFGFGMTIVVGFTERDADGSIYNSAAVIYDDTVTGIYRKLYPGRSASRPGSDLPIFWHEKVPFGILICNDAHYIEPARILAARGAALLVVPVHGGHRPDKELAWRARGTNVLVARAVENDIPLVAADVAGHQGERVSHGTTSIVDSQGRIVAAAPELEEAIIVADVDLDGSPRGGIDGNLLGRSNPAVTSAFLGLWQDQ